MCHRELLLQLHGRLEALRQARRLYAAKLAPDFNTIGWFGPDEAQLSRLLGEMLSPTGCHAQGAVFLELFLRRIGLEEPFLLLAGQAKVSLEKTTDRIANTMRRIDIYLDFGRAAIAIENKPWAGDQENQCRDYLEQLESNHPENHCLIYLSGTGNPPIKESICTARRESAEQAGHFKTLGYPQLIDWLQDCRGQCQADRFGLFLGELIEYIRKEFVGAGMTEMQEIVNIALADDRTLKAAMEIANAQHEIRYRLLDQLEQQLTDILPDGWRLEWKLGKATYGRRYANFRIIHPQATLHNVCFEFEMVQCGAGFAYGIARMNETLPDLPAVRDCLNQAITPGKNSEWWPWYWEFPAPYSNWAQNAEPWLDIQNGNMANMILKKTQAIYDALDKAKLLHQLGGNPPPAANPSAP